MVWGDTNARHRNEHYWGIFYGQLVQFFTGEWRCLGV